MFWYSITIYTTRKNIFPLIRKKLIETYCLYDSKPFYAIFIKAKFKNSYH